MQRPVAPAAEELPPTPASVPAASTSNPIEVSSEANQLAVLPLHERRDEFPAEIQVDGRKLTLNGQGLCEYGIFGIDLYYGAFYVERPAQEAAVILTDPQLAVVHLRFVRSLTKQQLGDAYAGSITANRPDDAKAFEADIAQLRKLLQDVSDGDSLTFTVRPGRGVWVQCNGTLAGAIESVALSDLFVELYIGPKPPTSELRAALLGGS